MAVVSSFNKATGDGGEKDQPSSRPSSFSSLTRSTPTLSDQNGRQTTDPPPFSQSEDKLGPRIRERLIGPTGREIFRACYLGLRSSDSLQPRLSNYGSSALKHFHLTSSHKS
jgi:hypothetical protein